MHVGLEERNKVGSCLADDEVIHVKKFSNAAQGGVAVIVGDVRPVMKIGRVRGSPGDNVALHILAEECRLSFAVQRGRGGVRCDGSGPYQLNVVSYPCGMGGCLEDLQRSAP